MNNVAAMYNDNRYERSPHVGRSLPSLLVAAVAAFSAICFLVVSTLAFASTLTGFVRGFVAAAVPLQPGAVGPAIENWTAPAAEAGVSFANVDITRAPSEIVAPFQVAATFSYALGAVIALAVLVVAVLTLLGRLRWGQLALASGLIGAVLAMGSFVADRLASGAASNASSQLEPGEWVEPGFFAGSDPTIFITGAMLVVLALALRSVTRFASAADGVV
jgi:hypothetical protein